MEHPQEFLKNLAVVLCVAAVTTIVFQKLKQPVVLGYLLAGLIIGPHIPIPLVADPETIHTLSELGVILLMFYLGIEFDLAKLFKTTSTAGIITLIQCSFMIWAGFITGQAFGWGSTESFFLGALISISSTTIILKAFEEKGVGGKLSDIVISILIFEDLVAILLLAVLTTLSTGSQPSASDLLTTAAKLAGFLGGVMLIGGMLIPPLMRSVVKLNRSETTLITCIGICFAVALLALKLGYSTALGAFLAGSLISRAKVEKEVAPLILPVRDMFAAIFFVAIGMTIDPATIAYYWQEICIITVVVVLGKIASVALGGFLTGQGTKLAVQSGMSLAQIGEFSFIIASLAAPLGPTGNSLLPLAVAVSAITTLLTPWMIQGSDRAAAWVDAKLPKPIQTFSCLYTSWLERVRQEPTTPTTGNRIRRWVQFLVVDVLALCGVIIFFSLYMPKWNGFFHEKLGLSLTTAKVLAMLSTVVIAAPFVLGILRCAKSLGFALALRALPDTNNGTRVDLAAAPRKSFIVTLQLGLLLLVSIPLLAVTAPFVPVLPGPLLVFLFFTLMALIFWRRALSLQGHVRAGAQILVEALSSKKRDEARKSDEEAIAMVETLLPGMGTLYPVRIESRSYGAGKSLGELNLRGLTGSSVLAIARGNSNVLIPQGRDVLQSGDVLALTGTTEANESAKRMLQEGEEPK